MAQNRYAVYTDFFTTGKGLTSTSANHLANIAKQAYTADEEFLKSCSFLNESMSVIGTDVNTEIATGMTEDELDMIMDKLNRIAALKSFCAWVREAIKEKELYVQNFGREHTFEKWCDDQNISMPMAEEGEYIPYDKTMSIADKANMLCEEAAAATFGGFIHPSGPGHRAYTELVKRMRNKRAISENGRDTIIREFSASVDTETVKCEFDRIRDVWRSHEAQVNKYKHTITEHDTNADRELKLQYTTDVDAYRKQWQSYREQYNLWLNTELKKIADLRIIIPEKLLPIYDELRVLGKDEVKK